MVYTTQLCNLETTSLWFIPPIYVINRPIFYGLYHPMVIWGMVYYYCFTHITRIFVTGGQWLCVMLGHLTNYHGGSH